jgi:hypothetical protein
MLANAALQLLKGLFCGPRPRILSQCGLQSILSLRPLLYNVSGEELRSLFKQKLVL